MGGIKYGFDVAERNGIVSLAWIDYDDNNVYHMLGKVSQNRIDWEEDALGNTKRSIMQLPYSKASPLSTTIGLNGTIWVAVAHKDSPSPWITVLKSSNGFNFETDEEIPFAGAQDGENEVVDLLVLSSSKVALTFATIFHDYLQFKVRDQDGWPAMWRTVPLNLKAFDSKVGKISAVSDEDVIHLAYVDAGDDIYVARIDTELQTNFWSSDLIVLGPNSFQPSISIDHAKQLHLIWVTYVSGDGFYFSYCRKWGLGWWPYPDYLFKAGSDPLLSPIYPTMGEYSSITFFGLYTHDSLVHFFSVQLPSDIGLEPSDPWNRIGLAPNEYFLSNSDEHVSPGNGLLYLKQEDLRVPGRGGFDLRVERVYVTPPVYSIDPISSEPVPFLDESPQFGNFGEGWVLNYPWVGSRYLHLWDGTRFVISWTGSSPKIFESHSGIRFKLMRFDDNHYELITSAGQKCTFDSGGRPEEITDPTGLNGIEFHYITSPAGLVIDEIVDKSGKRIAFQTLNGRITEAQVDTSTREVVYSYDYYGSEPKLGRVIDSVGKTTSFSYEASPPNLLESVVYPYGGHSEYHYASIATSTETTSYLVDSRIDHDGTSYVSGISVSYHLSNGRVTTSNVTNVKPIGQTAWEEASHTIHTYRGEESSETIRREDQSGNLLRKVKRWFLASGDVYQDDYYFGDDDIKTYSTRQEYDEYGNLVYSRDAIGHEQFSSYWNSSSRGLFRGGADLSRQPTSVGGKLVFDDFDELDFFNSEWQATAGANGHTELDSEEFNLRPPSLRLITDDTHSVTAKHHFDPTPKQNVISEFEVMIGFPLPNYARIEIRDVDAKRCRTVEFSQDGFIYVLDYDSDVKTSFEYSAGGWYRITIAPEGAGAYVVHVNGKLLDNPGQGIPLFADGQGCGDYKSVRLRVNPMDGFATDMWVDLVKVNSISSEKINSAEEKVFYALNAFGDLCGGGRGTSMSVSEKTLANGRLCHPVRVIVLSASGTLEYMSGLDVWPGAFTYSPPYEQARLERTASGFKDDATEEWADGYPPNSNEGEINDYLAGVHFHYDMPVVSGDYGHLSYSRDGHHAHYFEDVDPTYELHFSSGDFLVQYVYLSSMSLPLEIMLKVDEKGTSTVHRAYWGGDLIDTGLPRTRVADLPDVTERWVKLIVKSDEIGLGGKDIDGMSYDLFGGMAYYDFTSRSPSTSGSIRIQGLMSGQLVELMDENGVKVTEGFATGSDYWLNLYDAGIRVYPFRGFLVIWNLQSQIEYVTPNLEIWGGDEFTYHSTNDPISNFLPPRFPDSTSPESHDRFMGHLEFVSGRSDDPDDMILSFHLYDTSGLPIISQTLNSGSFESVYRFYDSYGNLISEVDSLGNEVTFDYDSLYNYAYLTGTAVSDTDITTSFAYDSSTGDMLSETNPRGYTTSYQYDFIGRLKHITYPEVDSYVAHKRFHYHDLENFVMVENENGHCTRLIIDGLGRTTREERLTGCIPPYVVYSFEEYEYNWQGNVINHRIQRDTSDVFEYDFEFDLLGRSTKIVNPDSTFARCEYPDQLSIGPDGQPVSITTCYDEENHKTESLYDLVGRLVEVREYYENSVTGYYDAAYTYDEVGNLLAVRDQGGLVTHHEYNNVGLLTKTIFADATFETYEYNAVGQLTQKTKRDGRWILFEYDDAGNMIKEWTLGPPGFTYYLNFSYDLNGNLIHARNGWTYDFGPLSPPDPEDPWHSKIHRQYDARDRLRKETSYIDMDEYDVQYGLDPAGNIVSLTYPDGSVVSYTYDSFERVVSVMDSVRGTIISQISYTHDDLLSTMEYGNGVLGEHSYYPRGNLWHTTYKKGAEFKRILDYGYYDDGNVELISTMQGVDTYFYDYLDRLDYATSDLWGQIDYEYDNGGNRAWVDENGVRTDYTLYDAPNRLMEIVEGGITTTFQYDLNGNMISRTNVAETWTYEYDFRDLVTDIWCAESGYSAYFVFDPLSRLLQEIDAATRNYIHAGPHTIMVDRYWEDDTRYIFVGGQLVANITGSEIHYLHQDHLGSTRLITDETGDSTGDILINYKPFGEIHLDSTEERQKFTGQLYVPRAGLYVLGVRFYDPSLGRFISEDPVLGSLGVPQTQNRYVYAVNNPLRHTDTSGRLIGIILLAIFIFSITWLACETVQWAQQASWQEAVGMLTGIGVAVLFGVALFFCPVLAIVLIPLAGAAAAVTYIKVTEFLGGTPTQEGVSVAFGWGMVIGGIGTAFGLRKQNLVRQGASENPRNNVPDEIDFQPPRGRYPGGRQKALWHRDPDIPEAEWMHGIKEIAGKPLLKTPNPKGGYQHFGYIAGKPVRVIVGREGMIVTGHRIGRIPWYTR